MKNKKRRKKFMLLEQLLENETFDQSEIELFEEMKGLARAYRAIAGTLADELGPELTKLYEEAAQLLDEDLNFKNPSLYELQDEYVIEAPLRIGAWKGHAAIFNDLYSEIHPSDFEKIINKECKLIGTPEDAKEANEMAWDDEGMPTAYLLPELKSEIIDNIANGILKGKINIGKSTLKWYFMPKIYLHNPNERTLFRNLSSGAKRKVATDAVNEYYNAGAFLEVSNATSK